MTILRRDVNHTGVRTHGRQLHGPGSRLKHARRSCNIATECAHHLHCALSFDYKNTPLAIIGAGSNCGQFTIQLARWAGFGTIIAIAGKTKADHLRELGATHLIDRTLSDDEIEAEVRNIVGGDLLHYSLIVAQRYIV